MMTKGGNTLDKIFERKHGSLPARITLPSAAAAAAAIVSRAEAPSRLLDVVILHLTALIGSPAVDSSSSSIFFLAPAKAPFVDTFRHLPLSSRRQRAPARARTHPARHKKKFKELPPRRRKKNNYQPSSRVLEILDHPIFLVR